MSDPAGQQDETRPDEEVTEARETEETGAADEESIDLDATTTHRSHPDDAPGEATEDVAQAEFDELTDQGDENGPGDLRLEMILDVPVTLTVEVGRTRVSVRDLLKLNRGSVVELDQLVTQPMSLLVNDTLVALGEAVMVNERFGIRLTEVVSAEQRIRKLG
jgi:flagellar motor switch protein FliN/FliY